MKIKNLKKINALFIAFLIVFSFKSVVVKAEGLSVQYNMDLIFNQKEKALDGVENVVVTNNLNKEIGQIVFHLYADSYNDYDTQPLFTRPKKQDEKITKEEIGDIKINKVLVDGKEAKYTENSQILKINLNETLKKNEKIQVYIEFKLKIPMEQEDLDIPMKYIHLLTGILYCLCIMKKKINGMKIHFIK